MSVLHVAIVSRSERIRRIAAAAFDRAPQGWRVTAHGEPVAADVTVCGPDDHIPGAIVLNVSRPEDVIVEVERRVPTPGGRIYVVNGVGGGAGATTVALHLSAALGRSCAYLDLDTTWGSAAWLGLDRAQIKTWADIQAGDPESVRVAALPMAPGFRALFAPHGDAGDNVVCRLPATVASVFDKVVVDAPQRLLDALLPQGSASVHVVPASASGLRRAEEAVRSPQGVPSTVVLNRLGPGGSMTRRRASEILDRPISIELPLTPALRDSEDEGRLLSGPWTRYSRRIARLAAALERS